MKRKISILFLASALFLAAESISFAQNQWKVGDKVEILNLSKEWVAGKIIGTEHNFMTD